jgi:hypothetical protein
MTDELQQARERIRVARDEALAKWRPLSGATYSIRETYKSLEANLSKAKQAADSAQMKVEHLRDDDLMNRDGRDRLIREAIQQGKAEVRKYQTAADACFTILKAEVAQAAVPRFKDPQREGLARDELRVRLDGATDPVAVLFELAQREDELGAVACSSYAESYLRAKGVRDAPKVAQAILGVAVEAAAQSADPARRAVGEAHAKIGALTDALVCTGSITRDALQAAGQAAQAAGVVVEA